MAGVLMRLDRICLLFLINYIVGLLANPSTANTHNQNSYNNNKKFLVNAPARHLEEDNHIPDIPHVKFK
jgi:hypothetical protein